MMRSTLSATASSARVMAATMLGAMFVLGIASLQHCPPTSMICWIWSVRAKRDRALGTVAPHSVLPYGCPFILGQSFERSCVWICNVRVIAAALGISLLCGPAIAQQADRNAPIVQLRKAFDDCVYESVAAQLHQKPIDARRNADVSSLGEQGFLACATEERALAMTLTINDVSPQVIQAALLGIRGQIKRTLRDIVANPARYAK
jgi:hypothetical protein